MLRMGIDVPVQHGLKLLHQPLNCPIGSRVGNRSINLLTTGSLQVGDQGGLVAVLSRIFLGPLPWLRAS